MHIERSLSQRRLEAAGNHFYFKPFSSECQCGSPPLIPLFTRGGRLSSISVTCVTCLGSRDEGYLFVVLLRVTCLEVGILPRVSGFC